MDVYYEKLIDIFWKLLFSFLNDYKYEYIHQHITSRSEFLSFSFAFENV